MVRRWERLHKKQVFITPFCHLGCRIESEREMKGASQYVEVTFGRDGRISSRRYDEFGIMLRQIYFSGS